MFTNNLIFSLCSRLFLRFGEWMNGNVYMAHTQLPHIHCMPQRPVHTVHNSLLLLKHFDLHKRTALSNLLRTATDWGWRNLIIHSSHNIHKTIIDKYIALLIHCTSDNVFKCFGYSREKHQNRNCLQIVSHA